MSYKAFTLFLVCTVLIKASVMTMSCRAQWPYTKKCRQWTVKPSRHLQHIENLYHSQARKQVYIYTQKISKHTMPNT